MAEQGQAARSQNHPTLKRGVLQVKGTAASEKIALRLKAGEPGTLQIDFGDDGQADFRVAREHVKRIDVDARGGDDLVRIDEANGAFTDSIPTTLDGEGGDDNLAGGSGAELLLGGDGNDSIDGNRGNDLAVLGAGDDTFVWDPGDGSDTILGRSGTDTMLFNGANAAERIDLSANGNHLRFFRDVGNITMDTVGVERVDFNALGGADLVTVGDLSGTHVTNVNADLEGSTAGAGDGQIDRVTVDGTRHKDTIDVSGDAARVTVSGPAATVTIEHPEPTDKLVVNGLGGNDGISAAALPAGTIGLTLDGGAGDDTIAGSRGVEATLAATGTTRSTATVATTWRSWARATTPSSGIRATAATPSKARTAPTRCCSTAQALVSASTCPRTAGGCASSATSPTSRWTRTTSRRSTSARSAEPTRSPSATSPAPT